MTTADTADHEHDQWPDEMPYEHAASYIGVKLDRLRQLVTRNILHPRKLPSQRTKVFRRDELDWYRDQRAGIDRPNPVLSSTFLLKQVAIAEYVRLGSEHEAVGQAAAALVAATLPTVGELLSDIAAHQPPERGQLERLRKSPEYQVTRQAIIALADLLRDKRSSA